MESLRVYLPANIKKSLAWGLMIVELFIFVAIIWLLSPRPSIMTVDDAIADLRDDGLSIRRAVVKFSNKLPFVNLPNPTIGEVHLHAIQILGGYGDKASRAVPDLIRVLGKNDMVQAKAATDALVSIGPLAAPSLAHAAMLADQQTARFAAEVLMRMAPVGRDGSGSVAEWILPFLLDAQSGPQLVAIEAELALAMSPRGSPEHVTRLTYPVSCVVGAKTWIVEHHLSQNARETCWLIGTNFVQHTVITRGPELTRSGVSVAVQGPPVGQRKLTVIPTNDGRPKTYVGVKIPWLAFCSGPFLKQKGREIPLPTTGERWASNYRDETVSFSDSLGLPQTVRFYDTTNQLQKGEYSVIQSTNIGGWNFPMEFVANQVPDDRSPAAYDVVGKVKSISYRSSTR